MKNCKWFVLVTAIFILAGCMLLANSTVALAQTTVDDVELGDDPEGDGVGDGAPSGLSTGIADEAVARVPNAADTDVDTTDFTQMSATIGGANIETITDLGSNVSGTSILLNWSVRIGATAYNVYRDTTAYFTPDRTGGSNRIATGITDEDAGTVGVQWSDTGNGETVVGDSARNFFYVVTGTDGSGNEAFNSTRAGEYDFSLGSGFNFITATLLDTSIGDAQDLGLAIDGQVGGNGANAIYQMVSGSWQLMAFKVSGAWVLTVTDAIIVGQAYLVNMDAVGTWTEAGGLEPDLTYSLTTGFDTVMLKFKQAGTDNIVNAQDLGTSIDAGAVGDGATAIYQMVNGSWQLMAFKLSGAWVLTVTDALAPGRGYLVNMSEDLSW
ncbi:MAG: hypothetical protein ACE5HO_05085 [bacterium]